MPRIFKSVKDHPIPIFLVGLTCLLACMAYLVLKKCTGSEIDTTCLESLKIEIEIWGALIPALSLCFILYQVSFVEKQFKREQSYSYMEHYYSPGFIPVRLDVDLLLCQIERQCTDGESICDPANMVQYYINFLREEENDFRASDFKDKHNVESNLLKRHHIWTFSQFLTEVSSAYNAGFLDDIGLTSFNRLIYVYWKRLLPYLIAYNICNGIGQDLKDKNEYIKIKDYNLGEEELSKLRIFIEEAKQNPENVWLRLFDEFRKGYRKLVANDKAYIKRAELDDTNGITIAA